MLPRINFCGVWIVVCRFGDGRPLPPDPKPTRMESLKMLVAIF
jgi:hypothetical protein